MPFRRKRGALQFTEQERVRLESIRRSRTEDKRRTLRAALLLDSLAGQSDATIARRHRVSRGTVVLCIRKCLEFGIDAALEELPRTGRPRQLPDDALAWVRNCASRKPKELGYSYDLWTYKLLIAHVRRHCVAAGYPVLESLSRSTLHKILHQGELRPQNGRDHPEGRDPTLEIKMANVLHVYQEVEIAVRELDAVSTVSLLAGLDLNSGKVVEIVTDTHKSRDFIAFLKKLDQTYPQDRKIRLVLDNHPAHISRETRDYLDTAPQRFAFVFRPKHGSWLNLIENQFSRTTRTMLREIRAAGRDELIDRIHQYFAEINADPVVFRGKYKMDESAIV